MSEQVLIALIAATAAVIIAGMQIREQRRNARIAKIEEFAVALDTHFRSVLDLRLRKPNVAHDESGKRMRNLSRIYFPSLRPALGRYTRTCFPFTGGFWLLGENQSEEAKEKNRKRAEDLFKSHSALKQEIDHYIEKKLTRRSWLKWRHKGSKVEKLAAQGS